MKICALTFNTAKNGAPHFKDIQIPDGNSTDLLVIALQEVNMDFALVPPGLKSDLERQNLPAMFQLLFEFLSMIFKIYSMVIENILEVFPFGLDLLLKQIFLPTFYAQSVADSYFSQCVNNLSKEAAFKDKNDWTFEYLAYGSNMLIIGSRYRFKVSAVDAVGCGIFGWLPNKGSVAARVSIDDLKLDFFALHLTPHEGNCKKRNDNFANILARTLLGKETADARFFLGDLNYRVADIDRKQIESSSSWIEVKIKDELSRELKSNPIFADFQEVSDKIDFAPTYKYKIDKLEQVNRIGINDKPEIEVFSKWRLPSWCDRILVDKKANISNVVKYSSFNNRWNSDHLPVIASLTLTKRKDRSGDIAEKYETNSRVLKKLGGFILSFSLVQLARFCFPLMPIFYFYFFSWYHKEKSKDSR